MEEENGNKKLTTLERDMLLGRLDERSESLIRELEAQSDRLNVQNGKLGDAIIAFNKQNEEHQASVIAILTAVYGKGSDRGLCGEMPAIRKVLYGILSAILVGLILGGLEQGHIINWFG